MAKQKKADASKMNAASRRMLEQREKKKQAIVAGEVVDSNVKTEPEEATSKEKVQL